MMTCEAYEREVEILIKTLKNKSVVLFGTAHMGILAKNALACFGEATACFADNSTRQQGKFIEGIPVLSPLELKEKHREASICICSLDRKNRKDIKEQLMEMGFRDFIPMELLIFIYYTRIADRRQVIEGLMKTYAKLFETVESSKYLSIYSLSLLLTEKCSLKCEECGHLIQYYHNPVHYDKNVMIQSIKVMAETSDGIARLHILGGEAFIYPWLAEVLEEIARLPNIIFTQILTNGTVLPDEKTINVMKKSGTHVMISDYGHHSTKRDQLIDLCRKNQIICVNNSDFVWYEAKNASRRNRHEEENIRLFKGCNERKNCNCLRNGEYHLCARSAHGTNLQVIPKKRQDFVSVLEPSRSREELRKELNELLFNTETIAACDYCGNYNIDEPISVVPLAAQIRRPLPLPKQDVQ